MSGITQDWRCWCSRFVGLGSWLVVGSVLIASLQDRVFAQITPDGTLPNNSSVTRDGNIFNITGGTQAGSNLFHSFGEFSVPTGNTAFFNNAADLQNIISRVTGWSASNIDGLIKTNGTANLFLINPNGIIFGPNARLDIAGSFVGTTANSVRLGETGLFSATEPQTSNLLAIKPSALFFNAMAARTIVNQSQAFGLRAETNSVGAPVGLQVPPGQTLALLGGNVVLEGGNLTSEGGRIELGSVLKGEVRLTPSGNDWILEYDETNTFGNVQLNEAFVDASGSRGGDVQIQSARFEMLGGSLLYADTLGSENGGEVLVRTTEAVTLSDGSFLTADVFGSGNGGNVRIETEQLILRDVTQIRTITFGSGNGGNVRIKTEQLTVRDGAQIGTGSNSKGDGGALTINATDSVDVIGTSADGQFFSGLITDTAGEGDAGNLTIKTGQLTVRDGATIGASTFDAGNGGSLTINATESIEMIGTSADGWFASSLITQTKGAGAIGNLTIETRQLIVQGGAQISAGTRGEGDGGVLSVNATESVDVIGTSADGRFFSGLITQTEGAGNAGDLTIKTGQLTVRDGATISASTFGAGDGGTLTINATESVDVIGTSADGQFFSGLFTETQGAGDAGDLTIKTGQLTVRDEADISAGTRGEGNGGDLTIKTRQLTVRDGAQIGTGTFGAGDGGSLTINATESVEVIGTSADGQFASFLSTQTQGAGAAGDLFLETGQLIVRDGAQISAGTRGEGDGGVLTINATESVNVIGATDGQVPSGLFTRTAGAGDAGDLRIETRQLIVQGRAQISAATSDSGDGGALMVKTNTLLVKDGAVVSVQSLGTGTAGNMTLNARSIRLDNNAVLTANTQSAKVDPNREQATININSENLIMSRNSNIITNATGENVIGGNINIDTDFLIAFENSDISANSANFRGGLVRINTQGIFGIQVRDVASNSTSDITATGANPDFSGTVELNRPDIDPNSGLVELPTIPVDTEVTQGCYTPGYAQSSFVITGRGGLPPNPKDILTPDTTQIGWVSVKPSNNNRSLPPVTTKPTTSIPKRIVEATGATLNAKGQVVLTANSSTVTPQTSRQNSIQCHGS